MDIHLPLSDGGHVRVSVSPDKIYGDKTGNELIRQYSKRPIRRKPKIQPIGLIDNDTILHIPVGNLPDKIRIHDHFYNTREFLEVIEECLGRQIISKRENRALKHFQNVSLRIPIMYSDNPFEPLKIVGKDKVYILKPRA